MIKNRRFNERGAMNAWQVATIGLSVLVLVLGSFSIWAFVAYNEAQGNVQAKIDLAVSEAKSQQKTEDLAQYKKLSEVNTNTFLGPEDYCSLTFKYSKTWSQYVSTPLTNGGDYKVFFRADYVPPVSDTEQFALRVVIEQKDYDQVIAQYDSLIKKGDLKASEGTTNSKQAKRLEGSFSKYIKGYAAIFKCRDKTITLRTDAYSNDFKQYFEDVYRTVDFN